MENQSYDKIEILLKKDANIELIKELVTSTLGAGIDKFKLTPDTEHTNNASSTLIVHLTSKLVIENLKQILEILNENKSVVYALRSRTTNTTWSELLKDNTKKKPYIDPSYITGKKESIKRIPNYPPPISKKVRKASA